MWSTEALRTPPEIAVSIGIVSDTHLPDRLDALPDALFDVLSGVDLILHAGDVGELRVLDALSALAPVVAVHGNDDTPEAQASLPYQQVIAAAGRRIVLCHGHHPSRDEEMAARREDAWGPKLARLAGFAQRAGAQIAVCGHAHIPFAVEQDGVLLLNPGALASPNYTTRMLRRTVALLYLADPHAASPDTSGAGDAPAGPVVAHVDLDRPEARYVPEIDWSAGFAVAAAQTVESILAPDLEARWQAARPRIDALAPDALAACRPALRRLAQPCWRGDAPHVTWPAARRALRGAPELTAAQRKAILAALEG